MATIRDNDFEFEQGEGISSISFDWNGDYVISVGQPWGGVSSSGGHIRIRAGRHKTERCATWYKDYVHGNTHCMVHTLGGSNIPAELNFAIKGTLTINGQAFAVCLGQGSYSQNNNWHLASESIAADPDNKNARIGTGFSLKQNGSNAFMVAVL